MKRVLDDLIAELNAFVSIHADRCDTREESQHDG